MYHDKIWVFDRKNQEKHNVIKKSRDTYLDLAKGVAIILVVVGHICQGARTDFDDFFPFRLIYSFHMPMFICLAGMVFSIKIESFFPLISREKIVSNIKKETWGATKRLLIPFVSWTVVFYFLKHDDGTLKYFKDVIASPDWSLWFLLALFYCRIFFEMVREILILIRAALKKILGHDVYVFENPRFVLAAIAFCFLIFFRYGPTYVGLGLLKEFFPYYVFGIFIYKYKDKIRHPIFIQSMCLVLFMIFMPYWYRTKAGPIEIWLSGFMRSYHASMLFHYVVAVCGTLAFLLIIRFLARLNFAWLNTALAFTGSMTLGIYALEFLLFQVPPVFFGVFLTSLLMTWLIGKTPVIRFFLLGEKLLR